MIARSFAALAAAQLLAVPLAAQNTATPVAAAATASPQGAIDAATALAWTAIDVVADRGAER